MRSVALASVRGRIQWLVLDDDVSVFCGDIQRAAAPRRRQASGSAASSASTTTIGRDVAVRPQVGESADERDHSGVEIRAGSPEDQARRSMMAVTCALAMASRSGSPASRRQRSQEPQQRLNCRQAAVLVITSALRLSRAAGRRASASDGDVGMPPRFEMAQLAVTISSRRRGAP